MNDYDEEDDGILELDEDDLEWDADDPAGDEGDDLEQELPEFDPNFKFGEATSDNGAN